MNDFIVIILMCLISCIISILLKQYLKEQSLILIIATVVIIIAKSLESFLPVVEKMKELFSVINIESDYYNILLKSLAISYISKISESICKDCNENSLAILIQTSGRITMTALALPMFIDIIKILSGVLK